MPARAASSRTSMSRAAAGRASTAKVRMTLEAAMEALRGAGTEQNRRTYARHGAVGEVFGVSFAFLAGLVKRIGVDHGLARALFETGNFDARNLALKIADPARVSPEELDRCAGWGLAAQLASRDPSVPEAWFEARLRAMERGIHAISDDERYARNAALIAFGSRGPRLRDRALAAARRMGPLEVDHGATSCETPDAAESIGRNWARAAAKSFPSPAAQESARKPPRTRC